MPHTKGLATRSPHLCRRVTFVVRTVLVTVLLLDSFVAGSILFKLASTGLRGAVRWMAEISAPGSYFEFIAAVILLSLVTIALGRLQLKLASRTITAHVVTTTLDEVKRILSQAPCNREELLRRLTEQLTSNVIKSEPRLIEMQWQSPVKKSVNPEMALEMAITTVRVFAAGPVPDELRQSLLEIGLSLRA